MNSTIYLVRHTKPLINEGVCYGCSDIELSSDFNVAALAVADKLRDLSFSKIYSSPLKRCHKLALSLNNKVVVDDRLKELNFGDWELKSWDYIFSSEEGKRWFDSYLTTTCPGGESFIDLTDRVKDFIDSTLKKEEKTLIVTHAGVIKAFLSVLTGMPEKKAITFNVSFGEIIKIKNGEFKTV